MFNDKGVLITGGTGSFGKKCTEIILKRYKPKKLIIFSRDELKQWEMAQQFPDSKYDCMRYFIGDVRDEERLNRAFQGVDYIIHAAALKQVPAAEYNPFEAVKTNIIGAQYVINVAIDRGVPFIAGMKQTSDAFKEKAAKANLDLKKASPFEVSDFQVKMGMDYLREEPKTALAKAWFFGMVKNLFAPSIIDFSYLLKIERPHFFYTEGTTTLERAWNFMTGMKGWFGWAVLGSMVLLGLARMVQVWGLVRMFRRNPWECLFLVFIIVYFLIVSGPVGYAKYRLPFEPILIVLLAAGVKDLYGRLGRRRVQEGRA